MEPHARTEQNNEQRGILTEWIGKVAFTNYLALLTRATADDDDVTPSYMMQEIEKITFQPDPHCQQLTEYLARRLGKPSAVVKLKVLKIMLHLIHNGHLNFRMHLRRNDDSVKLTTNFHGPADPLLGTSRYETVRKLAQDLLQVLFDPEMLHQEEQDNDRSRARVQLGGLGSVGGIKGKYEGFGSSPVEKEDTITGKVLDIFEKLVHPVDETAEVIKSALTSSPGGYEAVQIEPGTSSVFHPPVKKVTPDTSSSLKVHTPGRAGGGWECDEEETMNADLKKSMKSSSLNSEEPVSTDSLENLEPPTLDEATPEVQLVTAFCKVPKLPCSPSDLNETCRRCAMLNCVAVLKVVSSLLHVHPSHSDIIITRALLILEWFLRMDLVRTATIANLMSTSLASLLDPQVAVGSAVRTKAHKVLLILTKLQAL